MMNTLRMFGGVNRSLWTSKLQSRLPAAFSNTRQYSSESPKGQDKSRKIRFSKSGTPMYQSHPTKLVIFDKDGTLICYHSLYVPWARKLVKNLQEATGEDIENRVYERLGMCDQTGKILPGILMEYTGAIVRDSVTSALTDCGVDPQEAKDLVREHWRTCIPSGKSQLTMLDDLGYLFELLHDYGIKSAICTEDTRAGTVTALRKLGISQYIDKIVCGDDPTSLPKPNPHNLLMICDALNVSPSEAAYIGDRVVDMEMGREARIGKSIGVLTGAGSISQMRLHADHIIGSVKEIIPLILASERGSTSTTTTTTTTPTTPITGDVSRPRSTGQKQLVIFDKDGTLICFHTMWTPWAMEVARRIQDETRLNLSEKVMDVLGVSHMASKVTPGLLAEGTTGQVRFALLDLLVTEGIPAEEAERIITASMNFDIEEFKKDEHLKALGDVSELFGTLKSHGIKIAICTADSRESTLETLKLMGVGSYIDMLVCGDDAGTKPKPQPDNALSICKALNIHPSDAVMVGDTKADVRMGRSAALGLTVGVLSGVASSRELSRYADRVIPSIRDLIDLIIPKDAKQGQQNN